MLPQPATGRVGCHAGGVLDVDAAAAGRDPFATPS
jgi:hypothetical protein